jgi:hypothetical protein
MIKKVLSTASIITIIALQAQAAQPYKGFNLNGQAINPVCISKMRPLISDGGIIVKSIVLEQCQNSDWAFHDKPISTTENKVTTEIEGENFSYEVIGKTDSGLFIVHHTGNNIAAYRIDKQTIKPDLLKPETKKVHTLTNVGESFVPCFKSAKVKGNTLIVEKHVYDPNASHAQECKDETETVKYKIKP